MPFGVYVFGDVMPPETVNEGFELNVCVLPFIVMLPVLANLPANLAVI